MEVLLRLQDELNKPYYFLRPSQVFLRLQRALTGYKPSSEGERVVLPWGSPILVRPTEVIGVAILRAGIYDVCVSEVLWRLTDDAETAVDAGANIGHMTSIMALRVGGAGKVLTFEPHPEVFRELASNVALWKSNPNSGTIELHELALSKEPGVANLRMTADFAVNRGTATLEGSNDHAGQDGLFHSVSVGRLDDIAGGQAGIGVMKIDVEGHELNLLQGASRLLAERRIRDIVFEDHNFYPSPVTDHLEQLGYKIFSLQQGPLAVRVTPATRNDAHYKYEAQSYLATLDSSRALARLYKPGYQSLQANGNGSKQGSTVLVAAILALLVGVCLFAQRKRRP